MADGLAAQPAAPQAPALKAPVVPADLRGVPDPVLKIQAILDAEKAPAGEQPAQQPAQAPAPETEEPAQPNAQVEGEEAPPEEAKPGEIPLAQLEAVELEVTTKGEDGRDVVEKLTVKELREGYMKERDYRRKTAEVARQREEVGEKIRQGVESERSAYLQNLQQLQAAFIEAVSPELKDVNWNQLASDNPAEYVRLRNRADQIVQVLQGMQTKQQEAATKQKADAAEARKKAAAEARTTLEADIPGWNDTLYNELMNVGVSVGYKPEEVGQWVDPRAIKLLHKAHLYDKLQAGKPAPDKKVVVAPKVVKPGASQQAGQAQQQAAGAMKRLQASGKIEDAAAVIRSRLG